MLSPPVALPQHRLGPDGQCVVHWYAKALTDFSSPEPNLLCFEEDDIIGVSTALSETEATGNWLYGENLGAWGWFPMDRVRVLDDSPAAGSVKADAVLHIREGSDSSSQGKDGQTRGWYQRYKKIARYEKRQLPPLPTASAAGDESIKTKVPLDESPSQHEVDLLSTLPVSKSLASSLVSSQMSGGVLQDLGESPPSSVSLLESCQDEQMSPPEPRVIQIDPSRLPKTYSIKKTPVPTNGKTVAVVGAPAEERQRWIDTVGGADEVARMGLSKSEIKRQEVIHEVIYTERDYVDDLRTIIEIYIQPIKERKLLRPKDITVVFSNLEDLQRLNQEFLSWLEQKQKESTIVNQVGDLFIQISEGLKIYTLYCSNYPHALVKLQAARNSRAVAKFLDQCQQLPQSRNLTLANFLIKPVQRICKYPLLLKEMLKNTDASHADHDNLVRALLEIETVVTIINEGTRQAEGINKMLDIQSRLTTKLNLVAPSRALIQSGSLTLLVDGARKKRELFLFNDMLLMAKQLSEDPGSKLKVVTTVPFEMILINAGDHLGSEHLIEIIHVGQSKFKLVADSAYSKNQWLKAFQEATDLFVRNRIPASVVEPRTDSAPAPDDKSQEESLSKPGDADAKGWSQAGEDGVLPVVTDGHPQQSEQGTTADIALTLEVNRTQNTTLDPSSVGAGPSIKSADEEATLGGIVGETLGDEKTSESGSLERLQLVESRRIKLISKSLATNPFIVQDQRNPLKATAYGNGPPGGRGGSGYRANKGGSPESSASKLAPLRISPQSATAGFERRGGSPTSPHPSLWSGAGAARKMNRSRNQSETPYNVPKGAEESKADQPKRAATVANPVPLSQALSIDNIMSPLAGLPLSDEKRDEHITSPSKERARSKSILGSAPSLNTNSSISEGFVPPEPERCATLGSQLEIVPEISEIKANNPANTLTLTAPTASINRPIKSVFVSNVVKYSGAGLKDYVYIIEVFHAGASASPQSGQSGHIIYHTYDDFFSFHMCLIGHFPMEAGLSLEALGQKRLVSHLNDHSSQPEKTAGIHTQVSQSPGRRIIPDLPGQVMFVSEAMAKNRIGLLQEYINDLLKLPAKIVRSPALMNFFRTSGKRAASLLSDKRSG
ncbi:uncharacterized protein BJ171DRAFT_601297 [Polychytrium aggregatum]|uniref:uncharacterized protein n=1 Tax=Polychytrium aggregatum TaxID=110093 RepID=UPI0022FE6AB4|nr:uncharacterized protein BJ171DRAFT_601297 [Polychytrium aggregatum]KAI9201937.1 hypothetical protein BJ171DRAFT_601297 [Polychytrium aggregatum]